MDPAKMYTLFEFGVISIVSVILFMQVVDYESRDLPPINPAFTPTTVSEEP